MLEKLDCQDLWGLLETRASRARPEKMHMGRKEHQESLVCLEPMASLACQEWPEKRVLMVIQAHLDFRDLMASQEFPECPEK